MVSGAIVLYQGKGETGQPVLKCRTRRIEAPLGAPLSMSPNSPAEETRTLKVRQRRFKSCFGHFATLMVRSPRKGRMTRWYGTGPASSGTIMNPLALIKQQLEKAARLREAQMASLVYRGVAYVPKPHWF